MDRAIQIRMNIICACVRAMSNKLTRGALLEEVNVRSQRILDALEATQTRLDQVAAEVKMARETDHARMDHMENVHTRLWELIHDEHRQTRRTVKREADKLLEDFVDAAPPSPSSKRARSLEPTTKPPSPQIAPPREETQAVQSPTMPDAPPQPKSPE